jgi:MerR family transcriptional regulator, light-induced transcriptional regulator
VTKLNPIAAEVLEASAAGYAAAASVVHEMSGVGADVPQAQSRGDWVAHFKQRILELAAAVRVDEPSLFSGRVGWLRRAFEARGASVVEVETAMRSLRTALQQELPPDLRETVMKPIELALEALDRDLAPAATYLDPGTRPGELGLEYIAACLGGDPERGLGLVLQAVDAGMTPLEVYTRVLIPVQKEIGQFWHLGEISVAEERLISETTGRLMTLVAYLHGPGTESPDGPIVVLASVVGNAHDLGVRVVCELFRLAGWRCLFLGPNVPAAEIARAAEMFSADLVVLNATLTTQLKELRDAIASIKGARRETAVIIGGLALEEAPELWRHLGADGYAATVEAAVDLGRSVVDRN